MTIKKPNYPWLSIIDFTGLISSKKLLFIFYILHCNTVIFFRNYSNRAPRDCDSSIFYLVVPSLKWWLL